MRSARKPAPISSSEGHCYWPGGAAAIAWRAPPGISSIDVLLGGGLLHRRVMDGRVVMMVGCVEGLSGGRPAVVLLLVEIPAAGVAVAVAQIVGVGRERRSPQQEGSRGGAYGKLLQCAGHEVYSFAV